MRTALYLLFTLAAAAAVASFIPQAKNEPSVYERYLRNHPSWSRVWQRLGFFDVFGSLWFQLLLATLILVLLACLVPRTTALVRLRRSLARPPRLAPFPSSGRRTSLETELPADQALAVARGVIRGRGYRLSPANQGRQLVAERGFSRELGSLLFHWSFLVLIFGAALSQGLGFRGHALIVEGQRWAEDVANYNDYAPGRFYRPEWHKGFVLQVDRFDVAYRADGSPADFVSQVKVFDGGRQVREKLVRVNDPLAYGGLKFYQSSYGWAAAVRVRQGDEIIYDGPVVTLPGGPGGSSEGVIRIPKLGRALLLDYYPDPVLAPPDVGPPPADDERNDPLRPVNLSDVRGGSAGRAFGRMQALGFDLLVVRSFEGDLRSNSPQNVFTLDRTGLRFVSRNLVVTPEVEQSLGDQAGGLFKSQVDLGGVTVEFVEPRRFTVLGVKADPGVPVVGVAVALLLVGLVPSLRAWRRRLWVHVVEREGEATLVELGGVGYQRKERFDDEFTAVALRLRTKLPPVTEREPVA